MLTPGTARIRTRHVAAVERWPCFDDQIHSIDVPTRRASSSKPAAAGLLLLAHAWTGGQSYCYVLIMDVYRSFVCRWNVDYVGHDCHENDGG